MKEKEGVVIGIIGENGAGKDSFADFLKEVASTHNTVSMHRFSDPIVETAERWCIEKTRKNLQRIPVVLEQEFGTGLLAKAIGKRVFSDSARIIILNGVRWPQDLVMLRAFPCNLLVYITASPIIRYKRMRTRKEKKGESAMSWEQFLQEEQAPNEINIPVIGREADWKYENEGPIEELHAQVYRFYHRTMYPFLL